MSDDVTLCVLAGGEGSRMGRPKAEVYIKGKPILVHLLDRIGWRGATMLVTAPGREHPPGYERFDCEVMDAVAGEGPLRGLLTALQNVGTDLCIVTSVDMPLIERGQLRWLNSAIRGRPDALGLMTRHVVIEPFPSIYRRDAVHAVRNKLQGSRKSLTSLCDEGRFVVLDAPTQWDASVWTNLNTPDDLNQLQ